MLLKNYRMPSLNGYYDDADFAFYFQHDLVRSPEFISLIFWNIFSIISALFRSVPTNRNVYRVSPDSCYLQPKKGLIEFGDIRWRSVKIEQDRK